MDEDTVAAYLDRVAVTPPVIADAAAFRVLHRAHQVAVPFENLSIHIPEPISLDEDGLVDKIVRRRRGGFCYELNGGFALLLQALGAEVTRMAARVYGDGQLGPPFDHLALAVRLPDGSGPWLADVGFGAHSDFPLLLDSRTSRTIRPAGSSSLTPSTGTWTYSRTGSRSTGLSRGNVPWSTSRPPAGGSRRRRRLISPAPPSARGAPTRAGSRSAAGP